MNKNTTQETMKNETPPWRALSRVLFGPTWASWLNISLTLTSFVAMFITISLPREQDLLAAITTVLVMICETVFWLVMSDKHQPGDRH